ncbi:hypothetical protein BaRGS_00010308 [Batillaria attramentaria]|uniref:Uncharacterized protein n=1 Tax=Batillaria attramentaria TaxID=370345 RepID=A0ABD0LHB8_9CAEN
MANTAGAFPANKSKKRLPSKAEIPPRLRHRSRCSESDGGTGKAESAGDPLSQSASTSDAAEVGVEGPGLEPNGHNRSLPSHHSGPKAKDKNDRPYKSVFQLFCSELTRGYYLEGDESHYEERRERVYTFMATPRELEKFCIFGFLQCLDAFLFIVTFLPIRIVIALVRLLTLPCAILCGSRSVLQRTHMKGGHVLQPAQVCDLLKGVMVLLSCAVVNHIDTSMIYHLVRGQTVIKLYVFYNMLDLVDRVMSGFGQDVLDTLYWTATEPAGNRDKEDRRRGGVLFHFTIAVIYIIMHSFLIMCQVTVLNVAFNSHSKALLTIIMSNNFVEIKGNQLWVILPDITLVLVVELFVDWTKHAFITKFNQISPEIYRTFLVNLAQDMVTSRQKHAFTDYSDQVCRRLGFTPLPLLCLFVRTCNKSIPMVGYISYALLGLFFCCLVSLKLLTSIILLGVGCRLLEQDKELGIQTDPCEIDSQVIAKKAKATPGTAVEKTSPKKTSPTKMPRSVSAGLCDPIEAVSADPVLGIVRGVGDALDVDSSWAVRSASDSVIKQQCHSLQMEVDDSVLQGEGQESVSGGWEAESDCSNVEFHNSLDDDDWVASEPYVPSAQVVDFDEEKKHK